MNAELRRNLWMELTLHRLVALPVGLVLVFMLVYAVANEDPGGSIAATAAALFAALALWGGVHAGDAVMGEVRGRTWDGQRMSASPAWTPPHRASAANSAPAVAAIEPPGSSFAIA